MSFTAEGNNTASTSTIADTLHTDVITVFKFNLKSVLIQIFSTSSFQTPRKT
jgi:hypothetical protein